MSELSRMRLPVISNPPSATELEARVHYLVELIHAMRSDMLGPLRNAIELSSTLAYSMDGLDREARIQALAELIDSLTGAVGLCNMYAEIANRANKTLAAAAR